MIDEKRKDGNAVNDAITFEGADLILHIAHAGYFQLYAAIEDDMPAHLRTYRLDNSTLHRYRDDALDLLRLDFVVRVAGLHHSIEDTTANLFARCPEGDAANLGLWNQLLSAAGYLRVTPTGLAALPETASICWVCGKDVRPSAPFLADLRGVDLTTSPVDWSRTLFAHHKCNTWSPEDFRLDNLFEYH